MRARGIPYSELGFASRLTIPGAAGDAARYANAQLFDEASVVGGVRSALSGYASQGNPYSRALGNPLFTPAGGLGDIGEGWTDVLSTFVGKVGEGIGNRISGTKPAATPSLATSFPPPSAGMSTTTKILIGGVAAAGVLYLVLRKRGR